MNRRFLKLLVLTLCLSLVAAACGTPSLALQPYEPLSGTPKGLGPTTTVQSTIVASTSPLNNGSSGWSTYVDPQGLYSIQYPNSFGQLTVGPDPDTAPTKPAVDLTWNPLGDAPDLLVYISLDYDNLEHSAGFPLQYTLVANGLTTKLYGDGYGNERAFVSQISGTSTPTYYLDFTCNSVAGSYDCSLPAEWRQMLSTFRILPWQPISS
jgi:hypothetical protein